MSDPYRWPNPLIYDIADHLSEIAGPRGWLPRHSETQMTFSSLAADGGKSPGSHRFASSGSMPVFRIHDTPILENHLDAVLFGTVMPLASGRTRQALYQLEAAVGRTG